MGGYECLYFFPQLSSLIVHCFYILLKHYLDNYCLLHEIWQINTRRLIDGQVGLALLTSTEAPLCDLLFKHVGEAAACVQFCQPSVDELQP